MNDPYGELFEKYVHARFPRLEFIGDGRGNPDFDAGDFFLEAKCANSVSGAHISYSQFHKKRHLAPLYIIGFHDPVQHFQLGVAVTFSPLYVVSNHAIQNFFRQTKYLRVMPSTLDRISNSSEDDYSMRASSVKSPGLILHKVHDVCAIDFFK